MIEQVRLRDGTEGFVLPLLRRDRATLAAEFEKLSPESRYRRFLAPVMHLSEAWLEHLVDDVDGIDHVALVLCVETAPEVFDPVALARIVRYTDAPDAADLAVTVKDEWHGRGVATALLEVLMRHRPEGVTHLVTEVLSDNPASLAMLRRLGPTTVVDLGSGVSEVDVELAALAAAPSRPGVASRVPEGARKPERLLRDRDRRRALHTRDQLCAWLT